LSVDLPAWRQEIEAISKYLDEFQGRIPQKLREEQRGVAERLG
jgi:GTP-dependent phosphoenolpyruvate carboxykinase